MDSTRLVWMDFARGLCILLVILMHATGTVEAAGLEPPAGLTLFNQALEPFRMPLLMFLSGMLLSKSLDKPPYEYVRGKIFQIYWPYLLWSYADLATRGLLASDLATQLPWRAPTYLWYLYFLFLFYLVALALHRFRMPLLPVILLCLALSPFAPSFLRLSRMLYLFPFFLLGHLAVLHRDRLAVALASRRLLLACALMAAAGAILSANGFRVRYFSPYFWSPLALILLMLAAAPRFSPAPWSRPVEWIGRNGIVFYTAHLVIQRLIVDALLKAGWRGFWPLFLGAFAISLAGPALLQMGRTRHRLLGLPFDLGVALPARRSPA